MKVARPGTARGWYIVAGEDEGLRAPPASASLSKHPGGRARTPASMPWRFASELVRRFGLVQSTIRPDTSGKRRE